MIRSKRKFSFNPPINLLEEGEWLLGLSLWECTKSAFSITNGNNSFPINTPGHWQNKSAEKSIDELKKLLELRSLELHVKEVQKRGRQIIIGDKGYELSDFDTFKDEILE